MYILLQANANMDSGNGPMWASAPTVYNQIFPYNDTHRTVHALKNPGMGRWAHPGYDFGLVFLGAVGAAGVGDYVVIHNLLDGLCALLVEGL